MKLPICLDVVFIITHVLNVQNDKRYAHLMGTTIGKGTSYPDI